MNASNVDPTALRVARRHTQEAAVLPREVPTTRLGQSTVFAIEVRLMLERQTGYLRKFKFFLAQDEPPTTIRWEGVTERDELVTGKILLHATVADDEITSWAEVAITKRLCF
jgi:hypothetical protein